LAPGGDADAMLAASRCQALQAAAIQLDSIKVGREMTAPCAGEPDPAAGLIDQVQRASLPFAAGDRAAELAVLLEVIEMFPTASLTGQQKRAVCEERRRPWILDPGFRGFAEEPSKSTALDRRRAEVQPGLGSILDIKIHTLTVRQPAG